MNIFSLKHSLNHEKVDHLHHKPSSEMALIQILSDFHEKIQTITQAQMQGLEGTSHDLELASKEFLESLQTLFEQDKKSTALKPFFKALEYITSFMTVALGAGLCATGVASIAGSVMITTGVFGCIHTTLELTDSYKKLSEFTSDKYSQEIIKKYLPAMVATSLALSTSVTATYSATVALSATINTVRMYLPLMIQSLEASQLITKGVFDLHRNKAEAKKIDHEALRACLEAILDEQQTAMMQTVTKDSKMNQEALRTLKTLTSLYNHI